LLARGQRAPWRPPTSARPGLDDLGQSRSVILTQLACHAALSLPPLFEGGSGSRYTDGAKGKGIHHQTLDTYLLMSEAVAEVGTEEGFKT
jgi:hypothetical protein